MRTALLSIGLVLHVFGVASAQLPTGWKAHDWARPHPDIVEPSVSNLPHEPPSDAIVLFDGSDLKSWRDSTGGEAKWKLEGTEMESVPNSGYLYSAQAFGDVQLHVEWAVPENIQGSSQGRGNSGIFLMGLYEVQVLDSFDNITYADGQAGAVYGQYPPLVNASRRPGEWQSFDIVFHRPRFHSSGHVLKPATITVFHNGILVQDHVELLGPTRWQKHRDYEAHPDKLPLTIQDHGNPVRYRNIWLRELPDQLYPPAPDDHYPVKVVQLSDELLEKIAGRYGDYELVRKDKRLVMPFFDTEFEVITHSETELSLRYTATSMELVYNEDGLPTELHYSMGGNESVGKREYDAQE